MKKTLKVEGMMCGHCEARVKKALEALPEVDEAVVSHEAGTAIVTLNAEVADDVLKKAVEDLNKCRLARAVRAEQTDDLAGRKAQINAAQRLHRFKAPAQPGAFYQFFIHHSFSFPPAPCPRTHRGNSPALPFP